MRTQPAIPADEEEDEEEEDSEGERVGRGRGACAFCAPTSGETVGETGTRAPAGEGGGGGRRRRAHRGKKTPEGNDASFSSARTVSRSKSQSESQNAVSREAALDAGLRRSVSRSESVRVRSEEADASEARTTGCGSSWGSQGWGGGR